MSAALLQVQNLETSFASRNGLVAAVRGASFEVRGGEVVGIVGESGSGKTVTALSVLGLIEAPGRIAGGSVRYRGRELVGLAAGELRALRGRHLALVAQEAAASFNPVLTIGTQMVLALRAHRRGSRRELRTTAVEALGRVGISDPQARLDQYPHQLSGGMLQRVAIATALLHGPDLVIADEATSALDASTQAQILRLVGELVRDTGTALVWISHDLEVVASLADRCLVMYAGQIVEEGPTSAILAAPRHPYTHGLLRSLPSRVRPGERLRPIPGRPPQPGDDLTGCAFAPRCELATAECHEDVAVARDDDRSFRCIHPVEGRR